MNPETLTALTPACLQARSAAAQDAARWSDKQRQEAQAQLDISLAARTEAWKAKLWARKIQQMKVLGICKVF